MEGKAYMTEQEGKKPWRRPPRGTFKFSKSRALAGGNGSLQPKEGKVKEKDGRPKRWEGTLS